MKEWFDILNENKEIIISVVSLVGSICLAVYTKVSNRNLRRKIRDASDRGSYIICPDCKKVIPLSKVTHFYLPDGSLDDDLDGKPDKD